MLLLGAGPRALLLQIAHPLVAAGVDEHCDFRADPWRRLRGTLRSYLTIVYGTTAAARAEIRRLNALHRGIVGPGLRRPRSGAVAVGPRDARRLDDGRERRLDRAARPSAAGAVLRGDATDRAGVRRPGGDAAAPTSRRSTRTGAEMLAPAGPVQVSAARPRAGGRSSCGRRSPGAAGASAGCRPPLYDWTLWPSIGLLPAIVREAYGLPWDARQRIVSELARRRVACLAPAAPHGLPPDAAGPRRRPPARGALTTASRSQASLVATATRIARLCRCNAHGPGRTGSRPFSPPWRSARASPSLTAPSADADCDGRRAIVP